MKLTTKFITMLVLLCATMCAQGGSSGATIAVLHKDPSASPYQATVTIGKPFQFMIGGNSPVLRYVAVFASLSTFAKPVKVPGFNRELIVNPDLLFAQTLFGKDFGSWQTQEIGKWYSRQIEIEEGGKKRMVSMTYKTNGGHSFPVKVPFTNSSYLQGVTIYLQTVAWESTAGIVHGGFSPLLALKFQREVTK